MVVVVRRDQEEVVVVVVMVPDRGEVMGDPLVMGDLLVMVDLLAQEVMTRIREQAAQHLLHQRWMHSTAWQMYSRE